MALLSGGDGDAATSPVLHTAAMAMMISTPEAVPLLLAIFADPAHIHRH